MDRNPELLHLIAMGDEEALAELTKENMGLVKSIAARFKGRGTEYEDLVQIGIMGMIKAARSFDFSYGTVFSTYAVPLITGEIKRFLRDDGPVKVSRSLRKIGADAMRQRERFNLINGREPRISELAEACGITEEELSQALEAISPVHSLYEPAGREEEGQLINLLPDNNEEIENLTDKLALRQAVNQLEEQEKKIVYLRFFKNLSQAQTGKMLGLNQVKVSREEKRILEKLKKCL